MSYILEALKKSDAERKRGEVPTLDAGRTFTPSETDPGTSRLPWVLSGVLGVVVVGIIGLVVLRPDLVQSQFEPVGGSAPAPQAAPAPTPTPESAPAPEPTQVARQESVTPPQPVLPAQPEPEPQPEPIAASEPAPVPVPMPPQAVAEPEPLPTPDPEPIVEPVVEAAPQPEPAPTLPPVTIYTPSAKAEPLPTSKFDVKPEPEAVVTEKVVTTETVVEVLDTPAPESLPKAAPKAAPKPVAKPVVKSAPTKRKDAKVYVDQAWAAIDKGFYNQALRDLNRAVELEPSFADAWFARGWTNEKSGKELSAIGDYGRAITAQPNHAFALFSRGYLNLYIADQRDAVTDFVRTQGVAKDQGLRLYSHLWLYLSRLRTGEDAPARMRADTQGEPLKAWPGPLLRHYLGHLDEGRVLAEIESGPPASLMERRCTGYFFLGIKALENRDPKRARSYFEKTLATGAVQFRQYDAAKRELDRLNRS